MKKILVMMTTSLLVISAPGYAQSEADKAKFKQTPEGLSIEYQKQKTDKQMKDVKAATPANEGRPAVETQLYDHSVQSPKGEVIREQKKATDKAIQDAEAVKQGHPAATVKERGS
jgi:hypothetical protein